MLSWDHYYYASKDFILTKDWRNDEKPTLWQKYWFLRNLTKFNILNCKTVAFYYFAVNLRELSPQLLRILNIHIIYMNQLITNNILNVDGTCMLRIFLTKMFVSMTPHSWHDVWYFAARSDVQMLWSFVVVVSCWSEQGVCQHQMFL